MFLLPKINYLTLKRFCLRQGVDLFGVAEIGGIKNEFLLSPKVLQKMERAICLGARLSRAALQEIEQSPTKLYFHHYRNVNMFLDQVALRLCGYIQKKGYLALPMPASQIIDWEKQSGHLSHKRLAVLAGLGWLGRNNLLVNSRFGAQLRLVTVLTEMPLKADRPQEDSCASCRLCVRICPAGAIKETPAGFEHIKCFEKLKEFQKQRLVDQYICGVCVNACKGK